ncbi:amino acid ABC transporter permease [Nocardioidaceae bacterium SCSIO 66511]|nr:amino acid ABC transporter permease [Nocardioidaceae bacterium SCSIO 66511]
MSVPSRTVDLSDTSSPGSEGPGGALDIARRRHVGRWVVGAIVLVFAADLVFSAATNPNLPWDTAADYCFDGRIIRGLGVTLAMTVIATLLGTLLALVLATMTLSRNPVLVAVARLYITVFRSVPTVVQMLFWYYLAAVLPTLSIGMPFGPDLVSFYTNELITKFVAAMLGLALGEAAFLAEYFRAGYSAVPRGQIEAAQACGLTPMRTFRRVVLPQATRIVLPSYGNQIIITLKNTSVLFVIGAGDMMTEAQLIYSQNFQQIALLMVVITWYLIVVTLLTFGQRRLEARYSRGYATPTSATARGHAVRSDTAAEESR